MLRSSLALLLLFLVSCSTSSPAPAAAPTVGGSEPITGELEPAPGPSEQWNKVAEAYFEETLALNPILATSIGDNRYNDQFAVTISEEHRQKLKTMNRKYLRLLSEVGANQLTGQDKLGHQILSNDLENELRGLDFPSHLIPLNQFSSVPSLFAQLGSGSSLHPFRTVKDYEDFLSRVAGFELWVDTAIRNMGNGVAAGMIQPRIVMERVIPQLEAQIVARAEDSVFFRPIQNLPADIPQSDRERLTTRYRQAILERIVPAYQKLVDFVKNEYLPKTRSSVGRGALPGGRVWYNYLVGRTTTTALTAEEIHQIGLKEVARIHQEIEGVKEQVGFEGDLPAFFKYLKEDPRFQFKSQADLMQRYNDTKVRIDASTDRLFDFKPSVDYEIRPVESFREKSASSGSYESGTPDGSRGGVFYVNTYDLKARPTYAMEALSLHEGSPGHHFQISVQHGLESLPRFRRFGSYTAYIEGWGLYAETLGRELGVYTDPYQYYGKLDAELWRAIRLVLDTGIHSKGWTREQAIEYGLTHSSTGTTRVTAEVERFIAIPSQALAYKIGQLKISELRARSEKALGSRFNIKAFHREILEDGALPLDVLETKIDQWIAEQSL